ncbi:hypothetical protein OSB04_015489 [Centaurea solstitialis]|uniref:TIR domain-containing protein n=1 Tax=Centaurea solstitialis TaxID=347529 RepID=A0AA38SZ50_9ASTR|nr:hypothetical protein OSB04_015489 [Centaurea solstitialis]
MLARILQSYTLMASSSTSSIPMTSFKHDVFLSFRGEDTRTSFVDHLYHALKQENIETYKDDQNLERGRKISKELIQAIEESRFHVVVFSKNYASSSWCLDELVKIMECQKTPTEHIVYPIFYDVEPTQVRKQNGEFGSAFSKHENSEDAEKWRKALVEATSFSGQDLTVDKIWGIGGGGKTTLARAVFDQISFQFEGKSFVANVREVSKPDFSGLNKLQQKVLRDVSNDQGITVTNVFDGKNMLKKKMPGRKVLLVLDDVDHIEQLKALAGYPNWFKLGSKIIITTRDKQLLLAHTINSIHGINLLTKEEAIFLFSKYAFRTESPILGYEELSEKVVHYAAGLPLTITVLDADCKEIFLDVSCILKSLPKDEAIRVLESRGFHVIHGLDVLEKKSLVTTRGGRLDMHDRIEEMGRYIVRSLHPDEPNKHSRLWITKEIEDILANNQGIEATCIKLFASLDINQEAVMKGLGNMEKLRLLFVHTLDIYSNWKLDEVGQYFPNSLQYLEWSSYPFYSLPNG